MAETNGIYKNDRIIFDQNGKIQFKYDLSLIYNNISISTDSKFVINGNNILYGWGNNDYGQLGDNTYNNYRCTPVSILGNKKTFCYISAGDIHTLGLDYKGQVWSWGSNYSGGLGDNSTIDKWTPISIHGTKKTFCYISANSIYSLGLDYKGQVWSWGDNYYGQLGDNSTVNKCTPVSIHGTKKTFCQISAGNYHSSGIDNHGQVWSWGYNNRGQLGDGTITSRCTPVSILGNKKTFCNISAGNTKSSGIDNHGQVWGWGYNSRGQLGDGTITYRCTPVSIHGTKKTFCQISAVFGHSLGIDNKGQVWSWGFNYYGQLGDGTITSRCTPVSILGNKKTFCQISTGNTQSLGIDNYNQLWSWGRDISGTIITTPIKINI